MDHHDDNGGSAIKYHVDTAEFHERVVFLDEPCTDDPCTRDYVHVFTADEYNAINGHISSLRRIVDYAGHWNRDAYDVDWIADICP